MLDVACEQHELTDESEVRFITRGTHSDVVHWQLDKYTSVDCSMTDQVATIAPDPSNGPPADRRFGAGVLLLGEECVMRCTPQDILDQLDW
jgi:hypothetical protein